MKKVICLLVVLSMVVAIFAGCGKDGQQQSPEPTETVIENSEQQSSDEYEDALFADAAQMLNNKDYVAAYEIAEQSVSGKCKNAVEYAIADAFLREMLYGFDTINQIINTVAEPMQSGSIEKGLEAASSVTELVQERVEPLYRIENEMPKNILPVGVHTNYDAYLQSLDLAKPMLSTLTDCWNALGEQTEYMTEWNTIADNYEQTVETALDMDEYSNTGYIFPTEYRDLLDSEAFFNSSTIASALEVDVNEDSPSQESNGGSSSLPTTDSGVQENEQVDIPLEIEGIRYDTNSIGTPIIYIRVKNTGAAPIDAFDFAVKCFDNYGDVVKGYGRSDYEVCTYQGEDGNIGAGEVWSANENDRYWTMYGYDTATNYEVALVKVHTTDGTTYERNYAQLEWVEQNE